MSMPAPAWPLTCQYCRHAPATHLLVADLIDVHATHLVCWPCGERSLPDARKISKSRASAWLFRLVPVLTQEQVDEAHAWADQFMRDHIRKPEPS